MKRLLIAILLAFALVGCGAGEQEASDQGVVPIEELVVVKTARVQSIALEAELAVPGEVAAEEVVTVTAKRNGEVVSGNLEVGQMVQAGDVLFRLDETAMRLQREQAALNIELNTVQYDNAKKQYEQIMTLFASGSASQSQLDGVKQQLDTAKLSLALSRNTLAQLDQSLQDFTVTAPIAGKIVDEAVVVGQSASPGVPMVTLMNMEKLKVEAALTEQSVSQINEGDQVRVSISSLNLTVMGTVEHISPLASGQDKSWPVTIDLIDPDPGILPGMYAAVTIQTGAPSTVLAIPKEAVFHDDDQDWVYKVEDGRAVKAVIEKGDSIDAHFEVLAGLSEGEQVIVVGKEYVEDGDRLDIVE